MATEQESIIEVIRLSMVNCSGKGEVVNKMRKSWCRFLAVVSVSLLFGQMIPGPVVLGAEMNAMPIPMPIHSTQSLEAPKITLEEAILKVKNNFDVPSEYTDFSSTYNTYDDRQAWALRWNGTEAKPGELSAEVNALNGDILSMNYWKNNDPMASKVLTPSITQQRAQELCDNLLERLLGERTKELKLIPKDQEIVAVGNGPMNYSLQYQRLIKDKPFLGNGVNFQVSSSDGQILAYNLNWNDVNVPEEKAVINDNQAQQAFATSPFFKLEYWVPAPYRTLIAGQKQDAKLVYQLKGQSGGAIDAYTGEPIQLSSGEWLMTDTNGVGGMGSAKTERPGSISNGTQVLTPQEQQEVERTAKLLKRDEAIAAVKQWLEVPENLTLRSANLSTDWRSKDKRIWSFDWNSTGSDKGEGVAQYLSARVNASTGELLSFNTSFPQYGKMDAKYDRQAAQKQAEEFLKKVQPDRFKQVVIDAENSIQDKMGPEPWNTQTFSYHRVVNSVDFPDNGITVNVDPISGKVIGFDLNWSETALPSVSGILSKDQAAEAFLKARPLTLVYVRISSNGVPGNLRLVYLPLSQERSMSTSNTLDAKSGELLDYQGLPLEKGPKPYNFTDLSGVNSAPEIQALGQAGLFGDFGNSFKPQEGMSLGSLLRAMYLNRFGLWGNSALTDPEIMSKAKEQGWLKEDVQPGDTVNREILTKVLLRYIQLDKLADLKGIFQVKYQDAAQISSDALGYFALASSTGILKVEGEVLGPQEKVSRAEAAAALFRTLGWRN